MADSSKWLIALLIGLPIAALLAYFNKSGSDFKNEFEQKTEKKLNELPIITRMLFLRD